MLDSLKSVLPVPGQPIDTDKSLLNDNQQKMGIVFPDDYLEFSATYGSGTLRLGGYSWEICSAFRPQLPSFAMSFFERNNDFREAAETFDVPLGLHPEPGGLFPFGHMDDQFFTWKTDGSPNSWLVVAIWQYDHGGYQNYEFSFTEFIYKLITKEIALEGIEKDWDLHSDVSYRSVVYGLS